MSKLDQGGDSMNKTEILISDLEDIKEILDNNGYGMWSKKIMDALEIIKGIEKCKQGACSDCPYQKHGDDCMDILDDDKENLVKEYAQVIHCKDCKHWFRRECGTYGTCDNWHLDGFFDANWFCADGERA